MNTGKFHNWPIEKNKLVQAIKQGKCDANWQSAGDYLDIARTTLRDGMKREFGWELKDLVALVPDVPIAKKKKSYPPVMMKAAVFDIETTNFAPESTVDILACCSILPLDGEVYTIAIEHGDLFNDPRDGRVLQETINALSQYDILIGHNVAAFDLNWMLTRAHRHDIELPKRWLYYDTFQASKRTLPRIRKSLDNLCSFLGIDGIKTKINRPEWMNVLSPDEDKFNATLYGTADRQHKDGIIYHCETDVEANRLLFDWMWPRDRQAVNMPLTKRW
jgi:DNA polymerase III alpha subunit (gram-positive type)